MKTFRFSMALFIMAFLCSQGIAQTTTKQANKGTETYTAHNEGWMVSLDKAYEEAAKTGKPIMANFTGSDWCGWCIRLTKSVFSKPEFKKWAADNVVLLELDFPKRSKLPKELEKQNYKLAKAFKITGYPTVWVFDLKKDKNGKFEISPLGKTGFKETPQEFISAAEKMIANRAN